MANFFISDLHLGHNKALFYDDRPFCTLDEENAVIIERWNDTVSPHQHVYILGDVVFDNFYLQLVVGELNGVKHLIAGNHDKITPEFKKYFASIDYYKKIRDEDGRTIIMSHYPMAHWEMADRGSYHLYGHIHMGRDLNPYLKYKREMLKRPHIPYKCYNVGCMLPYMDYTPRTLDEIIEGGDAWENEKWKTIDEEVPTRETYSVRNTI